MSAWKSIKERVRWKYLLRVSLLLVALLIFCFFFLDPLAKEALETFGSKIAGAKVEVGSVSVGLGKTEVVLRSMRVADRNDPWKNLIEFEEARFNFALEPALSKKLVV